MNHIKAVMCDIDGTLLNDHGIITFKTIQAIQSLRDHGIYLVFPPEEMFLVLNAYFPSGASMEWSI